MVNQKQIFKDGEIKHLRLEQEGNPQIQQKLLFMMEQLGQHNPLYQGQENNQGLPVQMLLQD